MHYFIKKKFNEYIFFLNVKVFFVPLVLSNFIKLKNKLVLETIILSQNGGISFENIRQT